jgi:hypothetical protein
MGWGKRLASSFLLALGAALATWFGIGFGVGTDVTLPFTAVQQIVGTGAMFFFVFGAGMVADTADAIKKEDTAK